MARNESALTPCSKLACAQKVDLTATGLRLNWHGPIELAAVLPDIHLAVMAHFVPTEEQRADILESFTRVGPDKAIGYLPMPTILKILRLTIPAVERVFASDNRSVLALRAGECCIIGGAVYVFDQQALATLLLASNALLASLGWPTDHEGFIRRIAAEWLPSDHPLMSLVHQAFADHRGMLEHENVDGRSDAAGSLKS